jgi:hypothetical protein
MSAPTAAKATPSAPASNAVTGIAGSHQRPQAGATSARNAVKGKVKKWGVIAGATLVIILLLFAWKSLPKGWLTLQVGELTSPTEPAGPRTTSPVRERVISKEFTIPANGTVEIRKELRCHVTNLSDDTMKSVTQESLSDRVRLTSKAGVAIHGRMWFFHEGGDCRKDYAILDAAGLFR